MLRHRRRRPPRWPCASPAVCATAPVTAGGPGWCRACCRSLRSARRGRGADVPGRGAAAHPRRGHARRADPRQDRRRRLAAAPGHSPSLFVNAAAWGLLLTGKLVATHSDRGLAATLSRVVGARRRAADPQGRGHGHAHDGRAVRHRRDDRRGAGERPRARGEGFRYSYDMLGEAALTAADARRYLAPTSRPSTPSAQAAGAAASRRPGISIKLSALHPRYSARPARPRDDELYPGCWQLAELARRHDIGLNIDAEESDRLELSLDLLERLCLRAGAGRLERPGLRHPGLPEALPGGRRLDRRPGPPQRPPPDGAPGQGRLLGQRDQARAARRPGRLSGLYAQGAHRRRLHRLREQAAGGARRGLPAVRHPQRAHAGGHPHAGRPGNYTPGSTSSSACTAWASRCTSRSSWPTTRAGPALPHLCAGGHARHLLAYLVRRCWRTAPTPRS
jgi:hypothetical protein